MYSTGQNDNNHTHEYKISHPASSLLFNLDPSFLHLHHLQELSLITTNQKQPSDTPLQLQSPFSFCSLILYFSSLHSATKSKHRQSEPKCSGDEWNDRRAASGGERYTCSCHLRPRSRRGVTTLDWLTRPPNNNRRRDERWEPRHPG